MAVSTQRNYHHNDIEYANPKLIRAQSNMFFHALNHFDNNHNRIYNSVDGIFDIPKIKLYDTDALDINISKVKQGNKKIRNAVSKFLDSKIVNHCCAGAFANIEYTVYRKSRKNKYKSGTYYPKYATFHPHVHITLITKPHLANQIDSASLKYNNIALTKTKSSNSMTNRLSNGDYVLLNKEWNKLVKTQYNHFYLKDTYVKSHHNEHVKAYWSAGWGDYSKTLHPFCYARPKSRKITSRDTPTTVRHVANDIGRESNKYRGLIHAFYKGLANHSVKSTMHNALINGMNKVYNKKMNYYNRYHYSPMSNYYRQRLIYHIKQDAIHDGYDIKRNMNALKATYHGYHLQKNKYPRHLYSGILHSYAEKHIFNHFPNEELGDKLGYTHPARTFNQQLNHNILEMLNNRNKHEVLTHKSGFSETIQSMSNNNSTPNITSKPSLSNFNNHNLGHNPAPQTPQR